MGMAGNVNQQRISTLYPLLIYLEHNLALMESGNTLVHRAGIINAQLLHDMDSMAVNRFMGNAEQGGNTLIIIVGNQQFEDLALPWRQLFAQSSRRQFAGALARWTIEEKRDSGDFSLIIMALSKLSTLCTARQCRFSPSAPAAGSAAGKGGAHSADRRF
jgi:hypothetical protein